MLELVNLSCGYGAFNAAADLSLKLRPGTITALLGANGAGKSSTLMCVAGHVDLQAGKILFGLGFSADMQNTKCKEFSGNES